MYQSVYAKQCCSSDVCALQPESADLSSLEEMEESCSRTRLSLSANRAEIEERGTSIW